MKLFGNSYLPLKQEPPPNFHDENSDPPDKRARVPKSLVVPWSFILIFALTVSNLLVLWLYVSYKLGEKFPSGYGLLKFVKTVLLLISCSSNGAVPRQMDPLQLVD